MASHETLTAYRPRHWVVLIAELSVLFNLIFGRLFLVT